jgi:hypothetical protein
MRTWRQVRKYLLLLILSLRYGMAILPGFTRVLLMSWQPHAGVGYPSRWSGLMAQVAFKGIMPRPSRVSERLRPRLHHSLVRAQRTPAAHGERVRTNTEGDEEERGVGWGSAGDGGEVSPQPPQACFPPLSSLNACQGTFLAVLRTPRLTLDIW